MSCLPVPRTLYSTPTSVQTILSTTVTVYTRPETVTTDYRTTTVCSGDSVDERAERGRRQYPRQKDCSKGFNKQIISSVITVNPQVVTEPLVITRFITNTGAPCPVLTQTTVLCAPAKSHPMPDPTPTMTPAAASRIPELATHTVPLPVPTGNQHNSQKIGIIVGSIAAVVVFAALVFSLVCYFKCRGKRGGGPRADHSPRKTARADLDLTDGGEEGSGAGQVLGQASQSPPFQSVGSIAESSKSETEAGNSILDGAGGSFREHRPPSVATSRRSYPPPYTESQQASQTSLYNPAIFAQASHVPPYNQPVRAPAESQRRSSSHRQQGGTSTPPSTWRNSGRQREKSRLSIDTSVSSSGSSTSSRQSTLGGMGWIDPTYGSQSSIDKPWMYQPYGPYAGLARQEKPRRAPRPSKPIYFDTPIARATQPVNAPPVDGVRRRDSTSSIASTASTPQRKSRPLPVIPGPVPSSAQLFQSRAVPPTVLAQPVARKPPTAVPHPLMAEAGFLIMSSNQLPPSYYQTEMSRQREPASFVASGLNEQLTMARY